MRLSTVLCACGALMAAVSAQDPKPAPTPPGVPTPGPRKEPPKPVFSPPDESPAPPAAAPDAPASPPVALDAIDELFARFQKWPAKPARDAAHALSGLGTRVEARLVACLEHNDWRVQCGAAAALGEMGARSAVPALVRAIREPTNRQSLADLMSALAKVDPSRGPAEILPFLAHSSARVRDAALAALPPVLDARYLEPISELCAATTGRARATVLELFGRTPGGEERDELHLALPDPDTEVAAAAARLLGARAGAAGIARLIATAKSGTLRGAAYAMLALVHAEDRRGVHAPTDDDALRLRATGMLQSDDPLYRGAAACLLANLSFRADDGGLRELADKYLVPILLDAAAGSSFYNDYAAVEDVAFRKIEKLTGAGFGKNAPRWRAWWARAAPGFSARRLLRGLTLEELRGAVLTVVREAPGERAERLRFVGDAVPATETGDALVLGLEDCARVLAAFAERRFFAGATDAADAPPELGQLRVGVTKGALSFERRRHGPDFGDLAPVADAFAALADDLSWQRFAPADAGGRRRWIEDRRAELAATAPEERDAKVLEAALSAYRAAAPEGRAAAARLAARSTAAWRAAHAAGLAGWLDVESACTDQAEAVVTLLGDVPSPAARDAVFAFFARVAGPRAEAVFSAYLTARGKDAAIAALKDKHPGTRALGARALGGFGADSAAAPLLLDGLRDFDPRVRDACVQALAALRDPRTEAMLEAVFVGEDKNLRVRAIEAYGAVAGDAGVPRLTELFRSGGPHERGAALRAMERAGGVRAEVALGAVARESTDVSLAVEAVDALARIGGSGAAARLAALVRGAPLKDVRLQAIGALAATLGPRAAAALVPALSDPDATTRRVAMLASGRIGGRAALPLLLKAVEAPAGDAAAEDAFRKLTYFVSSARTPRERFAEARTWCDVYADRPRAEWFRAALERSGLDPSALDPALNGGALDAAGFAVLVRALKATPGPARQAADRILRRAAGITAVELRADADDAAVAARMRLFEAWAETRTAEVARGLPVDPEEFESSAPPPAAEGAESAPASREAGA